MALTAVRWEAARLFRRITGRGRPATAGDARAGKPQCSVKIRSPPVDELTVSATELTFGSATGAGLSGSYTRYG